MPIASGNLHASGYLLDLVLVAVASKLVQEEERRLTLSGSSRRA